jgi:hypothetical protein
MAFLTSIRGPCAWQGSRCGPCKAALDMLEDGLDLTPLITEKIQFCDVDRAVALASKKGILKIQLHM